MQRSAAGAPTCWRRTARWCSRWTSAAAPSTARSWRACTRLPARAPEGPRHAVPGADFPPPALLAAPADAARGREGREPGPHRAARWASWQAGPAHGAAGRFADGRRGAPCPAPRPSRRPLSGEGPVLLRAPTDPAGCPLALERFDEVLDRPRPLREEGRRQRALAAPGVPGAPRPAGADGAAGARGERPPGSRAGPDGRARADARQGRRETRTRRGCRSSSARRRGAQGGPAAGGRRHRGALAASGSRCWRRGSGGSGAAPLLRGAGAVGGRPPVAVLPARGARANGDEAAVRERLERCWPARRRSWPPSACARRIH